MIGEVATEDVRSAIVDYLRSALAGQAFDPSQIDDDVNLLEAGVIDSFGVLELIGSLEEQFGLSLDLEDVDPRDLATVGPLSRIVARACAGPAHDTSPAPLVSSAREIPLTQTSAPTSPTSQARGVATRLAGRSAASVHRLLQRTRGKLFSVLVSGAFESFGRNTVLQPPIRLLGEDRIAVGVGVFVGAGAWFQTLRSPEGERGSISIGDGSSFAGNCTLSAARAIRIGSGVSFARGVYIADHAHAYDDWSLPVLAQGITSLAPVEVGDGAWLGQNVVVLPGARIGRGAVVSANSVVVGDVPDYTVVAGAPARVVRTFAPVAR